MAIDGQKNVDGLRRRVAELPNIRNLITDEERVLTSLANAWQLGATKWSDVHPFIELIFGKVHEGRLAKLEQGLPLLILGPRQQSLVCRQQRCRSRGHLLGCRAG